MRRAPLADRLCERESDAVPLMAVSDGADGATDNSVLVEWRPDDHTGQVRPIEHSARSDGVAFEFAGEVAANDLLDDVGPRFAEVSTRERSRSGRSDALGRR